MLSRAEVPKFLLLPAEMGTPTLNHGWALLIAPASLGCQKFPKIS